MLRETTRLPRKYELMTIISPDVAEDELPTMVDRIGGYITAAGGTVTQTLRESPWGRRRLAYAIRHASRDVRDGFYTVYHFESQPSAIAEIERELRITDQVMRFLVTHYIPQPLAESPAEATEAETEGESAETPVVVEAETQEESAEAPVEAEAPAEAAPVVEETETQVEEAAQVAEAAVEEVPAPAKRTTRRKKVAAPEEPETTEEPAEE